MFTITRHHHRWYVYHSQSWLVYKCCFSPHDINDHWFYGLLGSKTSTEIPVQEWILDLSEEKSATKRHELQHSVFGHVTAAFCGETCWVC